MTYDIGDRVRLTATFQDAITGVVADPTGITLRTKSPTGTAAVYTYPGDPKIVKEGVGIYHADIDVTASGNWSYKWAGTGSIVAAEESVFFVKASSL